MIVLHRYAVEQLGEVYRVRNLDAPLCPRCGTLCSGYDTRSRKVIGDDGTSWTLRLRRLRCPSCGTLHLELPDFIRPGKRYAAAVIDDALSGGGECCPAEASTIWRWRHENHPPDMQCAPGGFGVKSTYSDTKEENHEEG